MSHRETSPPMKPHVTHADRNMNDDEVLRPATDAEGYQATLGPQKRPLQFSPA